MCRLLLPKHDVNPLGAQSFPASCDTIKNKASRTKCVLEAECGILTFSFLIIYQAGKGSANQKASF
jgi:hypothetical protein